MDSTTPHRVSRLTQVFFLFFAVMLAGFVVWAWYGQLDIVSVADGEVIPSGKIKQIQHLEGGIIREIKVQEGDAVTPGQPLVVLEKTRSGASVEELYVTIRALEVDIVRLQAEVEGSDSLQFPQHILDKDPELVAQARALFTTRKQRFSSEIQSLHEKIQQCRQRIQEIELSLQSNRQELSLLNQQIALSDELLKDNLTTKYKHLELLQRAQKIEGAIQEDGASLKRASSALKEAAQDLNKERFAFKETASEKLKQAKQEHKALTERLKKFADSLQRTVIRSPVEGVVKSLFLSTEGGVLKPGQTIAEVVPSEDRLIIEAHLPIQDIGYVRAGQKAVLQLASRDARKFDKLKGQVLNVSPDSMTDNQGRTFYKVMLETRKEYFEAHGEKYRLYPGMVVLAYIHIGTRSVLEYLLDPFLNTLSFSLQER